MISVRERDRNFCLLICCVLVVLCVCVGIFCLFVCLFFFVLLDSWGGGGGVGFGFFQRSEFQCPTFILYI